MSVDYYLKPRADTPQRSVWRLGEVLEELLGQYGLADTRASAEGRTSVCSEAGGGQTGLFAGADLPAVAASAY